MPEGVNVGEPLPHHRQVKAEHQTLPRIVEDRLVHLDIDPPEAIHAAEVVHTVHGVSPTISLAAMRTID
jgi:hypothetical protein